MVALKPNPPFFCRFSWFDLRFSVGQGWYREVVWRITWRLSTTKLNGCTCELPLIQPTLPIDAPAVCHLLVFTLLASRHGRALSGTAITSTKRSLKTRFHRGRAGASSQCSETFNQLGSSIAGVPSRVVSFLVHLGLGCFDCLCQQANPI